MTALQSSLLLGLAAAVGAAPPTIFFDPTAVKHSCVDDAGLTLAPGVPVHLTDIDTTNGDQTILLKPITANTTILPRVVDGNSTNGTAIEEGGDYGGKSSMCIFHRWTSTLEDKEAGRGYYYPLGRSEPSIPKHEHHGSWLHFSRGRNRTVGQGFYVKPGVRVRERRSILRRLQNGTVINVTNIEETGEEELVVIPEEEHLGYGDWNVPAGKASWELTYVCGIAGNDGTFFSAGEYLCEVTLPTTSRPNKVDPTQTDYNNRPYFLTYYERDIEVRNELSRFLQKNTFGPTSDELDLLETAYLSLRAGGEPVARKRNRKLQDNETAAVLNGTNPDEPQESPPMNHEEAMAKLQLDWVVNQMDPSTFTTGSFTSLRAYWRRRLNPRKEETYRIGESGPHPCEKNSRWRKFAFTNFDVQNSKMLRWGNQDLGGSYQTQKGHRITVETVQYFGPPETDAPTAANATRSPTLSPIIVTGSPTTSPEAGIPVPTATPTLSFMPTMSSAPSQQNILGYGDIEGTEAQIKAQWPGNCPRNIIQASTSPELVAEGSSSLHFEGGNSCFLFRPIGMDCGFGRVRDQIRYGDTLYISLKVRTIAAGRYFEMYTRHYHLDKVNEGVGGKSPWRKPNDDSNFVSRTYIPNANEWTTIEALHKVGDDWTFDGTVFPPEKCMHYHLRFGVVGRNNAEFYIDDVKMYKVGEASRLIEVEAPAPEDNDINATNANATNANATNTTVPEPVWTADTSIPVAYSGFFANPTFELNHQYWKQSRFSGSVRHDPTLDQPVMAMKYNQVLRQNIISRMNPGESYQFGFWTKITGADWAKFRVIMRMRFLNEDLENGPCRKSVCNFFTRALAKNVRGGGGQWQQVVSEKFDMFGNFTNWPGKVDFILFQLFVRDLPSTAEYELANFEMLGEDYTEAPSTSVSPSASPTNLIQEHTAYIVRYAGEIRTLIRYPFQIDKTGEVLSMQPGAEYQLCEVDEVEGRKADFPNRMNFFIGGRCQPIRWGNPPVDIDPNFLNMTDLLVLDLSNTTNATSIVPINTEQTHGGDWLLETAVQDEACATFPTPYDNDYRGADRENPNDIPTRFTPDKPVFVKMPDGTYALYDSRLKLHGNTLDEPTPDGGGHTVLRSTLRYQRDGLMTMRYPWAEEYYVFNDQNVALCANEQPNFLNEDHCVVSYDENTCVKEYIDSTNSLVDVQLVVTFDADTLAKFHQATTVAGMNRARYLYAVDNLRWDDTVIWRNVTILPCVPENPVSRWKLRPDLNATECTNTLTIRSNLAFVHALETSNDENPYLRDIYLWNDLEKDGCDVEDYDQYGMFVMTSEGCWENMHPDYMSIFDFTTYESRHATADTSGTLFIKNSTWTNTGIIVFPDNHPMSYFEEAKEEFGNFKPVERYAYASTSRVNQGARYGDSIILDQFADQMQMNRNPTILQSLAEEIATMKLANKVMQNRGGGTLVCGSPNEVAPDPTLDDYFDVIHRDLACIGCQDSYGAYDKQKGTVWAMNVLEGEDQLCQRFAWSLYEHLNVGAASNPDNTESNLYTYDILNRHCFGDYFDILKELTFSPKMGEQFNFAESASARIAWDTSGSLVFPDENYAREIMQLYTIGLHELNDDGTESLDEFRRVTQTYTNLDILSNARVFTGFSFTARRGNVEELFRSEKSRMDPLRIEVDKHDFFPKTSVDGNWIGDRYPLCVDLPEYHFLKIGAMYRFRGDSSLPTKHYNPPHWDSDESIKRFVLNPADSELYQKLCNPDENGACHFSTVVKLDSNLECRGKECRIDDVVMIQVTPGNFYEYIRQPCVGLSFYDNAKKIITGFAPWVKDIGRRHTHSMCADPRTAVAARSCCDVWAPSRAEYNYDFEYHGERVKLATIVDQCTADNGTVCDPVAMRADNPLVNIRPVYNYPYPSQNTFFWTDSDCTISAKVREDGMIAIVHQPAANPFFSTEDTVPYVDLDSAITFMSVTWDRDPMSFKEIYPSIDNSCGNGTCSMTHDESCLCSVTVSETFVYNSLPTRDEVLSLKIGAVNPASFSDADVTYSFFDSSDDVEVWVSSDSSGINDTSTIFRTIDEFGDEVFLKNMHSSITLGDLYELRNPPSFMNLARIDLRDAEYEVDAFLTHLVRYPSTAPFVSKKLIQYHGIANPSPGFVQRVTQAFISGSFTSGGVTFGTGKYGNLKAVAAAIALDPESLSPVIDEDPVSGNIREPLLKLIHFMRSLSFKRRPNVKFRHGLFDMMSFKIGQMVFDPPDQFSFFSSDYSPPGAFQHAGMVSPESELMSMSSVVGLTNGLFSFINYGLANADGGFGPRFLRLPSVGDYSTSMGTITYPYQINNSTDVGSKIDELSTLLTAGRLSAENKQVLQNAYSHFKQHFGDDSADRVLLKLLVSTPEFHTSDTVKRTGSERPVTPPADSSGTSYKAVVYINLAGGADSFNILTPHPSGCRKLYNEYWEARGRGAGIGLSLDEMLPIAGSSAGIPDCTTLGVNKQLSAFKSIYDEGSGIFFANMGHLHKPVTKDNWLTETRTDLFSHHTMKLESHAVDAFREGEGPGVLGRLLDVLEGHGHAVAATALNSRPVIVDGSPTTGRLADLMNTDGVLKVFDRNFLKGDANQQLRQWLSQLHGDTDDNSGFFGNEYSQKFVDIWNKTDTLVGTLRAATLATPFETPPQTNAGGISSQLKLIARLIAIRNERGNGINRDVFYADMGGFDSHFKVKTVFENKIPSLNHAVATFWAEMKAQGLENNIVVVQGSEFGRTITPNSNEGSDHAWGGNYFMFGGDVRGRRILGDYPRGFTEKEPINIGRGRLIPTTSWDALFYGLAQWMGVSDQSELDYVLPNSQNHGCNLFTDSDLFHNGNQVLNGCGGSIRTSAITFQVPEVRFLTGEEQKDACRLAVRTTARRYDLDRDKSRCFVKDMVIVDSEIALGMYDVNGIAVMNFDGNMENPVEVSDDEAYAITKATAATASDFVVLGALPQSEAPSESPSIAPTISSQPSMEPSVSALPSSSPSESPSKVPSISTQPSGAPSISILPSEYPSTAPSLSFVPTPRPTTNEPSLSTQPTPHPTARTVFEEEFQSKDIGYVGISGQSYETDSGLYLLQGSGADIWGTSDHFHYMYVETSGDATFTALVEGFEGNEPWAKTGIMFRATLSENSVHYSSYVTVSEGIANQLRRNAGSYTEHYGLIPEEGDGGGIWIRVIKEGNVFRTFYKPSGVAYWTAFGAVLSSNNIPSTGYYIGIAVSAHTNSEAATALVSNIELTRTCSDETITQLQCDQASNCEWGATSGTCYSKGEAPEWEFTTEVTSSIFDVGSTVTTFGCAGTASQNNAVDGTTNKLFCDRSGLLEQPTGIIIKPSHRRESIPEGMRVYAHNNCPFCDPVSYTFEGRTGGTDDWVVIHSGDLPWKTATSFPRNEVLGLDISSSYESADTSFAFTEVSFYDRDFQQCGLPDLQKDYRGFSSTTKSGRTCQAWSSQSPHGHSIDQYAYPDSGLSGIDFGKVDGCVAGSNLQQITGQNLTPMQCARKCVEFGAECLGVKYFPFSVVIEHSTNTTESYEPGDCIMSGTTAVGGCDNGLYRMVFYPNLGAGSTDPSYEFTADNNYCRNPDDRPGGAWCFTTDPGMETEYCDVPDCVDDPTTIGQFMEYKITWDATRLDTSATLQVGEIEIPGLLFEEALPAPVNFTGTFVRSILDRCAPGCGYYTGVGIIGGDVAIGYPYYTAMGTTHKFAMNRDIIDGIPVGYAGMKLTPSHNKMSIVQGIRVYTANNNPAADPVKYSVFGRYLPNGAQAYAIWQGGTYCWYVDQSGWMYATPQCDPTAPNQQFYTNELGEIRVKSLPGRCLYAPYGASSSYYHNLFIVCYSDLYGPNYSATVYQKFDWLENGQIRSRWNSQCIDYNYENAKVFIHPCHTGSNQQFYYDGTFEYSRQDGWDLIDSGDLPWISEFDRNPVGNTIVSTYESGDEAKFYMESVFLTSTTPYYEYLIQFHETRDSNSVSIHWAEIELPGLLLDDGQFAPPTPSPTIFSLVTPSPTTSAPTTFEPTTWPPTTMAPTESFPTYSPTVTSQPSTTPTSSPTYGPCPENLSRIYVNVQTDEYPDEVTWTLDSTDCNGGTASTQLEGTGYPYEPISEFYYDTFCGDPDAGYTFKIHDSYGDGICCGYGIGWYNVTMDGIVMISGGEYESSDIRTFGGCTRFLEQSKLLAGDGSAEDRFGYSVAIDGDTAIVGAYLDDDKGTSSGSAYILKRDAYGNWAQQAKLVAEDGATNDNFSRSAVAIHGNTAIIGAWSDDDKGTNSGAAYIFQRDAEGNWALQRKLTANDGRADDWFGRSVAIHGDTAIVGAYLDDDNGSNSGSAYIFKRDTSGTWARQAKLIATDGAANDWFGFSVDIYADTAVVGAYYDDDNGGDSGSAYIFKRDANGSWAQQAKLVASDGAPNDFFGYSIGIYNDTAIVGAWGDDDNGSNSGSAYIFEPDSSGNWEQKARLAATDGVGDDHFGLNVGIHGDTVIIGARHDDDNGSNSGSVYIFAKDSNGNWVKEIKVVAADGAAGDIFGWSVDIYGDTAIVGAPYDGDNGPYSGSAYIIA